MAVVEMQKVAIIAEKSLREELLEVLHHEGMMEISERNEIGNVDHTEVQFRAADVQFAVQTLKDVASKNTLAASEKPTNESGILHVAMNTDVRGIVDKLHELESSNTSAEKELQELFAMYELLSHWKEFPYALSQKTETKDTQLITGILPTILYEKCEATLEKDLPRIEFSTVQKEDKERFAIAHVWKKDIERFLEIATQYGWTTQVLPQIPGTVKENLEEISVKIKKLEYLKKKNYEEKERMSVELPNLRKVQKFLRWLDEKQSAREAMSETKNTVALLGWIPKKQIPLFESRLQKLSSAIMILKIKPDEGEEAPVLLKNPRWITPFQSVTTLYGLPLPSERDPTPSLTPFFALFFALCLTDAGYGLVLAIIFGVVLIKSRKTAEESPLIWTLFLGGIITMIIGVFFGGWFGLAPNQVPAFLTYETQSGSLRFMGQIWNLTEKDGIMFLMNLSLILGITHIFYGMFLAGTHKWIHQKKAAAFWMDFTSHILLGSILFYAASISIFPAMKTVAFWSIILALVLFIWGKGYGYKWYIRPIFGLIGLMNFSINILSNGLSYLRILALGLVTGSLAAAVNQVALALGSLLPLWLGIPLIIVICICGHLVSIALNTLGTFIHAGRLQFIEFFGQFFEGGGRQFSPYKRIT